MRTLATQMRRRHSVVALVKKEHRPLAWFDLRQVRHPQREAVERAPVEIHPDGVAAGRSLERFFDIQKQSRNDDAIAVGVFTPLRFDAACRGDDDLPRPCDPLVERGNPSV